MIQLIPQKKQRWNNHWGWALGAGIVLLILVSVVYSHRFSWGTQGDDTPGYLIQAARVYNGQPLVYDDELVASSFEWFEEERELRWVRPARHELIDAEDGTVTGRYPIGFGLFFGTLARWGGSFELIYPLYVAVAVMTVLLVYAITVLLLRSERYAVIVALSAALTYGSSRLIFAYAVSQPMRELPSIFILLSALLGVVLLYTFADWFRTKQWAAWLVVGVVGLLLGAAIALRITNVIPVSGIVLGLLGIAWSWKKAGESWRSITIAVGACVVGLLIALAPVVFHGVEMKQESGTEYTLLEYLAPNSSHTNSLKASQLVVDGGRFRPGDGGLAYYMSQINDIVELPLFFLLACIGAALLFTQFRWVAVGLCVWIVGTVLLFGAWINPYDRYILPVYPVIVILGWYGLYYLLHTLLQLIEDTKVRSLLFVATLVGLSITALSTSPKILGYIQHESLYLNKAISKDDLQTVHRFGREMRENSRNPIIMTTGRYRTGMSGMFEAHEQVRSIRSPFDAISGADYLDAVSFLDEVVDEYDLYVWIDTQTSGAVYGWLAQYDAEMVAVHDFTFQPWVRLMRVRSK